MRNIFICVGLAGVFLLVGCEETKSVEWWTEHHEAALKKEVECKKTGSDSQNCRNVKQANFEYQQLHAKPTDYSKGWDDFYKKGKN
ncbi:EexN family lipoprotein (plasmid) [Citrobacter freundii]|nr:MULTISPECIES: EexN family lipoprotein [Enterobacterales]HDL8517159.1 EexN family lipoprotein [Yersinia enterocolitica]ASK03922.1 entry exclusion protein [Citrobacter freundii]AXE42710.1 putative entry exclusion protein [Citrobacter portucalensis]ELR5578991.1 EexN family lipoprotein [Escherichia coli]MCX2443798.1 EexN family lipoprotein [Citrobacter freundii]